MIKEDIQIKAIIATDNINRCTIVLGTGVGKTLVGLKHIEKNSTDLMKCLVVAPKKSIFTSWKDDCVKFKMEHLLNRITFSTYASLSKKNPNEFDIVYLDEAHSLLNSHDVFLKNYKGKILGLTGTPPKHANSEKGILIDKYCPVVYTFKTDDAVESGLLNDYQIIVHELELSTNKDFLVTNANKSFLTSEYDNYNYWSNRIENMSGNIQLLRIMRMKGLMTYSSKEKYVTKLMSSINSKCILFANTQEQADKLCQYSYHSNNTQSDTNLERFKNGDILKLSSVMQLNEGVNIPKLKQGIIMHAYGNERKSSQRIGRMLRLNPDDKAIIHILCYMDTVDEKWVKEALENFDQTKILWKNYNIPL